MRATIPPHHSGPIYRWTATAIFAALLVAAAPAAADGVSNLAEKLSALRGEVEELSSTLARKDSDIRDQLKALSRQKTELELEVKKEQTRIQKVHLSIKDRRQRVSEEQGHDAEITPLFKESLEDVRAYVKESLPFRTTERLAELDKIAEQHDQGLLSASKALSRLWTFVEDEFRLTRESGLYKQAVEVNGQEHLAEVTRIGMVLLYFQVDDKLVGQAKRSGDTWKFEAIDDPDQKKLLLQLFESFKKQIRVGLFRVPASLPAPIEDQMASAPPQEQVDEKTDGAEEADGAASGKEDAETKEAAVEKSGALTQPKADGMVKGSAVKGASAPAATSRPATPAATIAPAATTAPAAKNAEEAK